MVNSLWPLGNIEASLNYGSGDYSNQNESQSIIVYPFKLVDGKYYVSGGWYGSVAATVCI